MIWRRSPNRTRAWRMTSRTTLAAALEQLSRSRTAPLPRPIMPPPTSPGSNRNRTAAEDGGRILTEAVEAMQRIETSAGRIGRISK